jgi:hypothetical protein
MYINNTTNLNTLKLLLSPAYKNVMYYIIQKENIYNSYDFGTFNPIVITINSPRTYKNISIYNGWFKPKFNTILNFKANEDNDLMNVVNRDFTFSNTNLQVYNDIPQLWYNNVVSSVTSADISTGNAISYASNFNVFKALWDADYYIKDNAYVNGYESSDELPAFFGSKLPKFPDSITLEKWNSTLVSSQISTTETTLYFNLTKAILQLFKTTPAFMNNWAGLSNADNIIDAYIKNTVITYYNLSQSKIKIDFYYKSYDTQILHYIYNDTFVFNDKQNFNGQLTYLNDEYIYKMIIPTSVNYSYFVKFTITEK